MGILLSQRLRGFAAEKEAIEEKVIEFAKRWAKDTGEYVPNAYFGEWEVIDDASAITFSFEDRHGDKTHYVAPLIAFDNDRAYQEAVAARKADIAAEAEAKRVEAEERTRAEIERLTARLAELEPKKEDGDED